MNNLRSYGKAPFNVAVVHGGPGAPGSVAAVARELSGDGGVLEPLQTASSVDGQVEELKTVIEENGDPPMTLIGSSWGAMLSFIFAARHPSLVKKAVLVGSGVFEEQYAANITNTRLNRLGEDDRSEARSLMADLSDPGVRDKNPLMRRLGDLFTKADAYDPLTTDTEAIECQYDLHTRVWNDAKQFRASGQLLALGKHIQCPVVAIHGDYDPHPAEGVQKPLACVLNDFSFVVLKHCGHLPWLEKHAKTEFYRLLRNELR